MSYCSRSLTLKYDLAVELFHAGVTGELVFRHKANEAVALQTCAGLLVSITEN